MDKIDKALARRFNELDDAMKMYFNQETMIKVWNKNADKRNAEAREFNKSKHWYQRRKPDNFPHYHAAPVRMPMLFVIPPTMHPQYKQTKKLIEDYTRSEAKV